MLNITKKGYSTEESWDDFYGEGKSLKKNAPIHISWRKMFNDRVFSDERFDKIEDKLRALVEANDDDDPIKMYPNPKFVFNAFNVTSLDELKVVFIGQDPYFNCEYYKGKHVPQATGLSFSVPKGVKIPSSLKNIFKNHLNYKRMFCEPKTGDLTFWACQGCLMLNTALTVLDGQKNCHGSTWRWVTDRIIKYISDECKHVVFVLWGGPANEKLNLIDLDKHDVVASSHPSGLSCDKKLGNNPPFNDQDHFGMINTILEENGQKKILWQT